jgi:hypothetical protein
LFSAKQNGIPQGCHFVWPSDGRDSKGREANAPVTRLPAPWQAALRTSKSKLCDADARKPNLSFSSGVKFTIRQVK